MKLECKVYKIDNVEKHPNADRLNIITIGGYKCITNLLENGLPRYHKDDLVIYIPEAALVPFWLLKELNTWDSEKNKGMLAGSNGNRVKAIKLRQIFSEGILYPVYEFDDTNNYIVNSNVNNKYCAKNSFIKIPDKKIEMLDYHTLYELKWQSVTLGDDVSEILGIEKYEPPVPNNMAGQVCYNNNIADIVNYDIESIQKYKYVIHDHELVEFTEKLHGTQTRFLFQHKDHSSDDFGNDEINIKISSKGMGDKGFFIKNTEENKTNTYVRAFIENDIKNKVVNSTLFKEYKSVTIFGETYGVQDLMYGLTKGQLGYRIFDVFVTNSTVKDGHFLNCEECINFCNENKLERVPSLYTGEFSFDVLKKFTSGNTVLANINQIREGVVIRPLIERTDDSLGRVILKSVSEDYKLRKGNNITEFN